MSKDPKSTYYDVGGIMKERPILFSAPMVNAILEGRKTQTRRVVKRFCPESSDGIIKRTDSKGNQLFIFKIPSPTGNILIYPEFKCLYGQPGDRLWVRETWQVKGFVWGKPIKETRIADKSAFHYRATDNGQWKSYWGKWRPSIHMPRWASRITLEITNFRVERLQDISAADAVAEGLARISKDGALFKFGIPDKDGYPGSDDYGWNWQDWEIDQVQAYRKLWESINGIGSWDENPFVWVIEFKGIDDAATV